MVEGLNSTTLATIRLPRSLRDGDIVVASFRPPVSCVADTSSTDGGGLNDSYMLSKLLSFER
jgi:hypothetical protein